MIKKKLEVVKVTASYEYLSIYKIFNNKKNAESIGCH